MRQKSSPIHHSMRGIAALWVVVGHLMFSKVYQGGFAQFSDFGLFALPFEFHFLAVDFFLMLSGCMLTLGYRDLFENRATRGGTIDRFYLLRLGRIYPLHLFTLAYIFATAMGGMDWPHTAGHWAWLWEHRGITLAANLALMQNWGILPSAAWNEPSWTISIFALLYVLFPNLVYLSRRIPDKAAWPIILGILFLYAAQRHFLPVGGHSDGLGAIIRGLSFFTIGMAVARLERAGWKIEWNWTRIFYLTALAGLGLQFLWLWHPLGMLPFHLLYPFFLLACLRAIGADWIRTAPFRWAGSRAYAIYMLHYPVMITLGHFAGSTLKHFSTENTFAKAACYLLAMVLVLAVAELGYRLVERPCQRWVKGRISLK